jgi:DNA-binding IclR family transcriptional regulator
VKASPGATIQQIAAQIQVSHAAASYLLRTLARRGWLEQLRKGRSLHHFVPGESGQTGRMAPLLADRERRRLIEEIKEAGPTVGGINQLAKRLGLSFGVVKSTLEDLAAMGLVDLENVNGRYRISTSKALEVELDWVKGRLARLAAPNREEDSRLKIELDEA